MGGQLQAVRGTKDIYPNEYKTHSFITQTAERISQLYGFSPMTIPVIEFTDVFKRTLGEESDVVGKEMYVFEDRGGESICLRPEFTAGIVRSFISSGLTQNIPLRLYTTGPLFRYERPQKGRQRQFHQVNFEMIGEPGPMADIELIAMGVHFMEQLGIAPLITLEINSLGDEASRLAYRDDLVRYFKSHEDSLSADSKIRLQRNPLRILDSKDENDKKIIASAPIIESYYTPDAANFFKEVCAGLDVLGVKYKVNPRLVRGLDYYCHTAFEFTTEALGAQNTVFAGGRYDKLIEMMGGPSTPAVGCAGGVERLVGLVEQGQMHLPTTPPVVIIPIGDAAQIKGLEIMQMLRHQGTYTEILVTGAIKKRMKKADQKQASHVIMIGDEELARNSVKVKTMVTGHEEEMSLTQLANKLQ